jgi:hypothetical protein
VFIRDVLYGLFDNSSIITVIALVQQLFNYACFQTSFEKATDSLLCSASGRVCVHIVVLSPSTFMSERQLVTASQRG